MKLKFNVIVNVVSTQPRPARWIAFIFCAVFTFCLQIPVRGADLQWSWKLPPARYQEMSVFERSQYDKAVGLIKQNAYKAAATEFEKFQTQFADSKLVSHALFMRAYCLHQEKSRGAAIKIYNEVMDFYGQKVEDATPALYFMGMAHIENGDIKAGLKCMQEIVDDPDYSKHPLAAGALKALGDNCWRNNERDKAVAYWKRAASDDFRKTNLGESNEALDSVIGYYIINKDYSGYESWYIKPDKADDAKIRFSVAENAWNVAWNGFAKDWDGEYNITKKKEKAEAMKAFWDWFRKQKPSYENHKSKNDGTWIFYERSIRFLFLRYDDKAEQGKIIDEAVAYAKKLKDKAEIDAKLAKICDVLRESKSFDLPIAVADQISERPLAEFKKYELYAAQKKWEKAIACLDGIEGMKDEKWKIKAMNARAATYAEMGKYEDAIKLYQMINQPPGTLWGIQDCYKRWGKLEEALQQLTEIENSFPDQAPKAAWQKADYLAKSNNREKAIAQARRIMKVYPKSEASSKAHQLLEKYGVKTGGGLVDGEIEEK